MLSRRALLLSSLATSACGSSLKHFEFDRGLLGDDTDLKVRFMGVCCAYFEYAGIGLLTDPFWSFLRLGRVGFGRIASDPGQIEPYLPALDRTRAVLVGHNHYDHVMDLPYVIDRLHPDAVICGSQTLAHTFAPMKLGRRFEAMNNRAATATEVGEPLFLAGGRLRVLAIRSGHPAQYMGVHLYTKRLTEDRERPPTRVGHYQEGLTLAFLVDWLKDDGSVDERVMIETSSDGAPSGYFPRSVLEQAPVDLGFLAMDTANKKARGEESVLDYIQPRAVLFCHWENFFRPKTLPPKEIVKVDLPKLQAAMPKGGPTRYLFPAWDSDHRFPVSGD
jgi:L-ascorbate metabolism protein UlaG (beta-lactamase superfamily)